MKVSDYIFRFLGVTLRKTAVFTLPSRGLMMRNAIKFIVVPSVAVIIINHCFREVFGQYLRSNLFGEAKIKDVDELDFDKDDDEGPEDIGILNIVNPKNETISTNIVKPSKFRRYILRLVRLKYHVDDYPNTSISRNVIRKYVHNLILKESRSIRSVDLRNNVEYITELFFIPTPMDVEMKAIRNSYETLWRINEHTGRFSRHWFNIFYRCNQVLARSPFSFRFQLRPEGNVRV